MCKNMAKKDNTYQEILQVVQNLHKEVTELRLENAQLKNRVKELEHKKDSNNSSIPPSKDENRPKRNQSLRIKTGKKSGGQKGHTGHTLKMVSNPNQIIDHFPCTCKECGMELSEGNGKLIEKRQVVELPPIEPIYIEHRSYATECSCGTLNKSSFPDQVKAPIQYGTNVENLVAYLSVGQYISYNRIASMFKGLFNLPLSEGSIYNMLARFASKSIPFYEQIRKEIESAEIVGADETGAKMNGEKWWFWTWQNNSTTYITASDNRGFKTVQNHFPNGFENATLLSDRYGAHLKTKAKAHQICISHLIRDINYLIELTGTAIMKKLKQLLELAMHLKNHLEPDEFKKTHPVKNYILRNTVKLLNMDHSNEHKKVQSFFKQLGNVRPYIYEFLYDENVPPDNNSSERAIRNVKVKQKVSTMFKSKSGINNYAVIRSVFDTCLKRDIPILEACKLITQP